MNRIPAIKSATVFAAALAAGLAAPAFADSGAQHQTMQGRPIELGVSGSSIEHIISGPFAYCYTGTLGSLVSDGTTQYILSNNHVLAKENDPDNALSPDGRNIIQPGLLDEGTCTLSLGDANHIVAYLSDYVPLQFGKGRNLPVNYADAAVAAVDAGDVAADGAIKDVGVLTSSAPAAAATGMQVQKSGRTTGQTFGEVVATNVTVKVSYDSGNALFENQIEVQGLCGTNFSAAGDSGSLVATLPSAEQIGPRAAVGLLFAGGGSSTFANTMGDVFAELASNGAPGLSMVTGGSGNVDDVTNNPNVPTCTGGGGGGGGGNPGHGKKPKFAGDPAGLERAIAVAERNRDRLLAIQGVVGYGIGADEAGNAVIRLYVEEGRRRAGAIPAEVEGVRVQVVVTGKIKAY